MPTKEPHFLTKLAWSLPWLTRYPIWRAKDAVRRLTERCGKQNLIFIVANHFEPGWNGTVDGHNLATQIARTKAWHKQARSIGSAIRDHDNTPFRHTNFYPAEQYYKSLLDQLSEMQSEGLGEVEVHLHHGVDAPDTAANTRRALEEFRDVLAEEHKCLSRRSRNDKPMYSFVHGNWALANSAGGHCCGVDNEMQILADTGCYADLTLPAIHSRAQVPRLNAIYQCGGALGQAAPHRLGPNLRIGKRPVLPILITGPLTMNWQGRRNGLPMPRLDDGALTAKYKFDLDRLDNWRNAHIGVHGRPEWLFIKLYCHGFFDHDQASTIGEPIRKFLDRVLTLSGQTGEFTVHFATAREAYNIAMAAVDGRKGEPGLYRDYELKRIMDETVAHSASRQLAQVS